MSKGVLIQASFYEAMQYLPDEERLQLYDGICAYSLKGILPENLSPVAMSMFILMKPNIDSSSKRYTASVANGKKGGRKTETQEQPSENLEVTQEEPSVNLEATQQEPSVNLAVTQEEPSVNLAVTQEEPSVNQSNNQNSNQSHNQKANQKPNHDYDYDLDYNYDYDSDSDLDSDSDSQRRGAALAAAPKSPKKETDIFFQESKLNDRDLQEEFCKKRQKAMDMLLKSTHFSNDRASPVGMLAV